MAGKREATVEDLYHVPEGGKAEIVDGELVLTFPFPIGWSMPVADLFPAT